MGLFLPCKPKPPGIKQARDTFCKLCYFISRRRSDRKRAHGDNKQSGEGARQRRTPQTWISPNRRAAALNMR
jgi:hypothetical protein